MRSLIGLMAAAACATQVVLAMHARISEAVVYECPDGGTRMLYTDRPRGAHCRELPLTPGRFSVRQNLPPEAPTAAPAFAPIRMDPSRAEHDDCDLYFEWRQLRDRLVLSGPDIHRRLQLEWIFLGALPLCEG